MRPIKFLQLTHLHSLRVSKPLVFFFFWGLFLFSNSNQQDSLAVTYDDSPLEIKKIIEKDIAVYTTNSDFNYEVIKHELELSWWNNFKIWLKNKLLTFLRWFFDVDDAVAYLAIFLKIIPYILLLLLLVLLIKFFLNVNSRFILQTKKNSTLVSLSEEEHIIRNEDIQQLIQKALANENYRLTIRYYYLYTLQLMAKKELITWELQKTNDDYLNEIKKQDLKQPFSKITRLYNYIWYGNFDIDKAKFSKAETSFLALQTIVKNG